MNFLLILISSIISAPVVSDNDILMTRQGYGECHRDLSVDGNPLKISGVTYQQGIGTHATSMIPITVPSYATALSGACGVDDEVTGKTASIIFQILSGSEVIWSSSLMHKGDAAATFTVPVPAGSTKLYLFADEYDTNEYDHADWVNLEWSNSADYKKTERPKIESLRPNTFEDQGPILRKMISDARSKPGSTIRIEKGDYHFYSNGSLKMSFSISNHDQPTFQPIAVPLVDLHNITLDCSGSTFYFHNLINPFLIMDSSNVVVKNLHVDYFRPFHSEGRVISADYFSTTVEFNTTLFPFHITLTQIVFDNEGFTQGVSSMILFDGETGRILENTGDVSYFAVAVADDDKTVSFSMNLRNKGAKSGDVICFRTYERPHPCIVIYRSNNTLLDNVQIHSAQGMAVICQRSDGITLLNSGVNNGAGRYHSSSADATHFSNCKGEVRVEGCLFEGMMDDAINVHSTSLKITEKVNESCVKLNYVHKQSVGFETFLPGEKIQFIKAKTLELDEVRDVINVRKLSTTELMVVVDGEIPPSIKVGDAVENAIYYPSVVFRNNTVRNNRARGCLFTTPLNVVVEDNFFDYTSGSAVLLAGDAANWYESGSCRSVVIRNNRIVNALTSSYQFTNAIFSFFPTIGDVKSQVKFYHLNISITGNIIDTYDIPLLYSISCKNMWFTNNTINYNDDFSSWKQKAFQFNRVSNVTIEKNIVSPEKSFTMDDVKLENTDESEIHIN